MVATTVKSRKAKGKNYQNWVAAKILEAFPVLTERDVLSTTMGDKGVDVKLSQAAVELFPYSVECKAVDRVNLWESWKQARANTGKGLQPALFIKRSHLAPVVVIDAEHFLELVRKES